MAPCQDPTVCDVEKVEICSFGMRGFPARGTVWRQRIYVAEGWGGSAGPVPVDERKRVVGGTAEVSPLLRDCEAAGITSAHEI